MPVSVKDLPGSPVIGADINGNFFARRTVEIAWTDIDTYFRQLMPSSTTSGTTVTQYPGESFSASFPNLRVHSVTCSPRHGGSDQITNPGDCGTLHPTYNLAKVEIEYKIPTSPQTTAQASGVDPVPFLEHRMTSGGQLLSLEQGSDGVAFWVWESSGDRVPDDTPVPVFIGTTQHSVHWPKVPTPKWDNLEKFKGTVNASAFTLRGYAYPAETLLYLNYDSTEVVMTNGSRAYSLTLHFEGKLVRLADNSYGGHNHYWNKEDRDWDRIHAWSASTVAPYRTNDFTQLFISG